MKTRKFSDLPAEDQMEVIGAFLGRDTKIDFTEKLAGQNLTVAVNPDKTVTFLEKGGAQPAVDRRFPPVNAALKKFHPRVADRVMYVFEVLKKVGRSDFINYPLEAEYTVIELTGAMSEDAAQALNSAQDAVKFMTKNAIKKSVGGVVRDEKARAELSGYQDRLARGEHPPNPEAKRIESLLMNLIDKGAVPGSLGSAAIEGLFGTAPSGGFKIPTTSYADVQRDQAKFFAAVRKFPMSKLVSRFKKAVASPAGDELVSDVLEYIDKTAMTRNPKGFRSYFSREETTGLKSLADAYRGGSTESGEELAKIFFNRVKDRAAWVTEAVMLRLLDLLTSPRR